ncbi:MAG: TRAP transporter substrate-binding protein DctP [Dehalococcoidales bacterium]|nr:TRAP transporter substrate-binding protein DctP [Dehalococcoidales bacterium]
MKKTLSGILAIMLVLALVIAGCAQQAASPTQTQAPATSQPPAATSQAPATTPVQAPPATSQPPAAAPVVFRVGHDMPPTVAPVVGLNWWAEQVTKQTNGRVKVELYPASSLATQANSVDAVRTGVADMYWLSTSSHRKTFPITQIPAVPGAGFDDDTEAANVSHVNTFLEFLNKYPAAAEEFKDFAPVFFYFVYSESYLASSSKKVTKPEDIKGMKVGSNGARLDFVNSLGGAGVTDVPPTAYEKLQTGVTDAAFAAISAVYDFKIYEVTKYILDFPFGGGGHPQIINKNTWNKISPEDQKIMMDLAPEASRISSQSIAEANMLGWKTVEDMGKRTTVTPEEKALWDEEFSVLWEDYIKEAEAAGLTNAREAFEWWKEKADASWSMK